MTSVYPWLKKIKTGLVLYLSIIGYCELSCAQIIPDNTLGFENSLVNTNVEIRGNIADLIQGGAIRERNLFHSFLEFNLGEGRTVYFANPDGISNIITRITGNNLSEILGTLGVDGDANLLFLNPNGIVFGENAQLDLSGSFLVTTGNSFIFDNGIEFSATQPETPPLLTINMPLGLQFGGNLGTIRVQGQGHNFTDTIFVPFIPDNSLTGLGIDPGNTLALLGGNLSLDGGILAAPGGNLELGSVEQGTVSFTSSALGWNFDYQGVDEFGDINLSQLALVDAGSVTPGSIQLQGKNILVSDGSIILMQNFGSQPGGDITIRATESLEVQGVNLDQSIIVSILTNDNLGVGKGGNLYIDAGEVLITEGGSIVTRAFSDAPGGNVEVKVAESLEIIGFDPTNPDSFSIIGTTTLSSGDAGSVDVIAKSLSLVNGGLLFLSSFSTGNSGNLNVNVTESTQLIGVSNNFIPSTIASTSFDVGNAGNVTLNTAKLLVQDGGRIGASTINRGNAGSVTINAEDFVEVKGIVPGALNPSLIISSANIIDESLQETLGLPILPEGNSGNVTINTPQLNILDGATVTVRNDGTGNGGNLTINADNIFLDNSGSITASTELGEGGNLNLNLENLLQLRNGGQISAEAGEIGNGGNININADIILSLENSRINANAFAGNGGNIQIDTQGIFLVKNANISASSEFGVDGVVLINTPISEPKNGFVELRAQIVNTDVQIAHRCGSGGLGRDNSFVVTGRGGLAPSPDSLGLVEIIVPDLGTGGERGDGETRRQGDGEIFTHNQSTIVEAQGWIINERGKVELVAYPVGIGLSDLEQKMINCGAF